MYLNIENLVKFYNKENPLIKDLNFTVNKGEFVSFIGESGSGKTTFLKCLAGLEGVNSGKISLNNRVLNDKNISVKPNLRKIGFIFQDYPLFPHLNVIENLKINLDEKYEINEDQNSPISNVEPNITEPINDNNILSEQIDENIPAGVSIESASYMESSNNNSSLAEDRNINIDKNINLNNDEEYTPKLFSDEDRSQIENELEETNSNNTEKLFDQDINEEEDFEIPAFLRKQKF